MMTSSMCRVAKMWIIVLLLNIQCLQANTVSAVVSEGGQNSIRIAIYDLSISQWNSSVRSAFATSLADHVTSTCTDNPSTCGLAFWNSSFTFEGSQVYEETGAEKIDSDLVAVIYVAFNSIITSTVNLTTNTQYVLNQAALNDVLLAKRAEIDQAIGYYLVGIGSATYSPPQEYIEDVVLSTIAVAVIIILIIMVVLMRYCRHINDKQVKKLKREEKFKQRQEYQSHQAKKLQKHSGNGKVYPSEGVSADSKHPVHPSNGVSEEFSDPHQANTLTSATSEPHQANIPPPAMYSRKTETDRPSDSSKRGKMNYFRENGDQTDMDASMYQQPEVEPPSYTSTKPTAVFHASQINHQPPPTFDDDYTEKKHKKQKKKKKKSQQMEESVWPDTQMKEGVITRDSDSENITERDIESQFM